MIDSWKYNLRETQEQDSSFSIVLLMSATNKVTHDNPELTPGTAEFPLSQMFSDA